MALRPGGKKVLMEQEHYVTKLLKILPAGPTQDGEGSRSHELVQFVAKHGGIRTVRTDDLIIL